MELQLKDTVAFISGSSRGIGLAIAEGFLSAGAKVAISGRNADDLEAARASLAERFGPNNVLAICGDLLLEQGIEKALQQTEDAFGPIKSIVANIGSGRGPMGWDLGKDDWQSMMDVNFFSGALLASAGARRLEKADGGSITFISSIAGEDASLQAPIPYAAAKAAGQMTVKHLARRLAAKNIRVNAVSPGNVLFEGGSWAKKCAEDAKGVEDYISQHVPLNRFATPQEIADAVVFLASPRAAFVTGTILDVDGGQSLS